VSTTALVTGVTIFVLALLVGVEVIGKVPATLHTPLMSAANSIHGIVLVGAMLIAATARGAVGYVLAFAAAFFAGANVVGGYAVTGRMLKMFRRRTPPAPAAGPARASAVGGTPASVGPSPAVTSPQSAVAADGGTPAGGQAASQPATVRLARSVLARSGLLGRKERW